MGEVLFKVTMWSNILSTHIPFVPCQSALPFLSYFFSSKLDLEIQRSRLWVRSQFKVTMWVSHPINSHPFCSMSIGPPIPEIQHFQNLTLKIKCQGQMTLMLQNYRSRQFHRTSNGINPSSGFKDMRSAKSGPNLWQVFGPWASPYGANGQMSMTVHNYRPIHWTLNGENPSSGYRDIGSASLAAACPPARPPARPPRPWRQYPSSPEGWRVKRHYSSAFALTHQYALSCLKTEIFQCQQHQMC